MRKAYISLREWRDNTDGHLYREGEPFPFDAREIPKERLEALESGRNRAGLRLIRAVEVQDEPEEARKEEEPKKAPEVRKTVTRKKTTTKK
jgi:hypothetical protein